MADNHLSLQGNRMEINRGTPALIASAIKICDFFSWPTPFAYLIGDKGTGSGSRKLYAHLETHLPRETFASITFHYLQPDVDWHNRVLFAVEAMKNRPILIADAGFMYAAKMSGQAGTYDVFTPDIGELSFLADEEAPHPFYTRGFILHEENRVPDLIERAYLHQNAARFLMVKGSSDVVACRSGVLSTISEPNEPFLEPIGGTGDILTGLVAALTGMGRDIVTALIHASTISRLAGQLATPTPGTQVVEIIRKIPESAALFYHARD
jgi:hypothetical protein